jgi:hypothetical protein
MNWVFRYENVVYIKGNKMRCGTFTDYSFLIKPIIWLHGNVFSYKLEISTGLAALWGFQLEHSGVSWSGIWQQYHRSHMQIPT